MDTIIDKAENQCSASGFGADMGSVANLSAEQLQSLLAVQQLLLRPVVWNHEGSRILERVGKACAATAGILLRRDLKAPGVQLRIEGTWNHHLPIGERVELGNHAERSRLTQGERLWVMDRGRSDELGGRLKPRGSACVVPLLNNRQLLGVLCVEVHPAGREGRMQVEEYLDLAAAAIGAALERSVYFRMIEESRGRIHQEHLMGSLGQLAGGMAHEFNNLLTVIQGYADVMIEHLPKTNPNRRMLSEIQDAAKRAGTLTRQLTMFGTARALKIEDVDLRDFFRQIPSLLAPVCEEKVDVRIEQPGRPISLRADPGFLQQALVNLALNARDAMPDGGELRVSVIEQTLHTRAEGLPKERRPGAYACISVSDSGCGISPAVQKRVFEPFFTTKSGGDGNGLGLAAVYSGIERHEGWVDLSSAPGEGTVFRLYLPIAVSEEYLPSESSKAVAETPVSGPEEPGDTTKGTILLVDDEASLLEMACNVLETFGYRVLTAANGPAALQIWEQEREAIDLLITDLVMPLGMSGIDLAEKLRKDRPEIKVIYISGYTEEMQRLECRAGESAFLAKPFRIKQLADIVRSFVSKG